MNSESDGNGKRTSEMKSANDGARMWEGEGTDELGPSGTRLDSTPNVAHRHSDHIFAPHLLERDGIGYQN